MTAARLVAIQVHRRQRHRFGTAHATGVSTEASGIGPNGNSTRIDELLRGVVLLSLASRVKVAVLAIADNVSSFKANEEMRKMKKFIAAIQNFVREEDAPTAVEYGVMVALIAAVVVAGATALGANTLGVFNAVAAIITPVAA